MKLATLALALGLAAPAFAAPISTVDFEKAWDYGQTVDDTYAALGVSFVNVIAFSNGDGLGPLPTGDYYVGAPSMMGVAMAQLDGTTNTSAFMNVLNGVSGGLSFFYSSPVDVALAVEAYSGLNGTGTLLGSISLTANSDDYTAWSQAVLNFGGTAMSFSLTNAANVVAFDNISSVPEPSSAALMLTAVGVLAAVRRRRS